MNNVFVYGTLKKGYSNHRLLEDLDGLEAKANGITLHAAEFSPFPFAQRGVGFTLGEVYSVPDEIFKKLDVLEGHPKFYRREKIRVELVSSLEGEALKQLRDSTSGIAQVFFNAQVLEKTFIEAWIYLCPKRAAQLPKIESGKWEAKVLF